VIPSPNKHPMGETYLNKIISFIDEQNHDKLRKALEEDNSVINDYVDMEVDSKLAVRMTPIQVAVKVKAPTCVAVLLEFGADIKMKLLTPENKPLSISALELAEGERAVAMKNEKMADIAIYDEIVQLIKEHGKKKKKKKAKKIRRTKSRRGTCRTIPTKTSERRKIYHTEQCFTEQPRKSDFEFEFQCCWR